MNSHRKNILDKFYQWVDNNTEHLPSEVTDVTAEIWNLEEECEFWRLYAYRLKQSNDKISASIILPKEHGV